MAPAKAIASRTFELGATQSVEAIFFAPIPDGDDWRCQYRIVWPDRVRDFYVIGIDGVQALQLAMKVVGAALRGAPEAKAAGLTWHGEANLGLPDSTPEDAPPT